MITTPDPWAPYEPSPADPWDLRKVGHLHRRAGFGASWSELQRDLRDGPQASVDRLLQPPELSTEEAQVVDGLRQGVLASRDLERLKAFWLYRILFSPDPLGEKLTLFWHGHFATSARKVQDIAALLEQNETLRRHALGEFAPMLSAIAADPAMLVWLDGGTSKKEHPNENFAREFLELFTIGVGHYSEADIRAAARAFTGWARDQTSDVRADPKFHFDAAQHDGGAKTFLGQTGPWSASDIVRITLEQPAAAVFLVRKLYRFFVSEQGEPSPELIEPLAAALRDGNHDPSLPRGVREDPSLALRASVPSLPHGVREDPSPARRAPTDPGASQPEARARVFHYSIRHVVGTILRSRHFYAQAAYRQRIKGPVEFAAGLVRTLEVPRDRLSLLALSASCDRQGQELFAPPNVKGWDGGLTWLNSSTLIERNNWATDLVWGNPNLGMPPFDSLAWVHGQGLTPERATAAWIDLLLEGDLNREARERIEQAGGHGWPDDLRRALQLVAHCPEFQLG